MDNETLLPLSEHLHELKICIFRCIAIIAGTFCFLLICYEPLIKQLIDPYTKISISNSLENEIAKIPISLEEVRNTSKKEQVFTLSSNEKIIAFHLSQPQKYNKWLLQPGGSVTFTKPKPHTLVMLSPTEGFMVMLKVCFWCALFLSLPLWGYFFLHFVLPAFHRSIQLALVPILILSFFSAVLGILFGIKCIVPLANQYFIFFNSSLGENLWSLERYIDYTLLLLIAQGITFEIGAILLIFVHHGVISPETMTSYRRHSLIACFIIGALLTPPDVLTQLFVALPLYALYELSILYGRFRKSRQTLTLLETNS